MYIYLSNENEDPVEVFFDDFKVEHITSPVVQMEEYYPVGLRFNSFQRESSVDQRWKFQGQEHIDDLGLNWDSFKWRNHQPDIGRFFNVDPLAEKFVYNSPYAFSENKVTSHVELEGLEAMKMPNAVGMVKHQLKKIERAVVPVVGEVLQVVGIDLPGLNLPRESTDKQQKGDGIHIYSDSSGPDAEYAPAPDPNANNPEVEKSVIDAMNAITDPTKLSSPKHIGDKAEALATSIEKANSAKESGEKVIKGDNLQAGDTVPINSNAPPGTIIEGAHGRQYESLGDWTGVVTKEDTIK